ncbi:PAAR domain-containing protein [Halomonas sp. SpR8]|uniref:PAAR domain-containing protein n=1 Tax=Halomonas sp. SpR8 TaxID=3050463 RepID=UPI0027E43078|nr:PAAR domain-containing protein [Halomonas sp. SpR8]MDQ7729291.1 PAAR domain-containing protein [Halomonas sp. SpR8]
MDLAKIGDEVACSCKGGPHRIVTGASTAKVDGIPIARVGDNSSCGATIIAGVAWYVIEGSPAAIHGSATSCGGQILTGSSTEVGSPTASAANLLSELPKRFNERFRLINAVGEPVAGMEYLIVRDNGEQISGVSDAQGLTRLVSDHDKSEKLQVYIKENRPI